MSCTSPVLWDIILSLLPRLQQYLVSISTRLPHDASGLVMRIEYRFRPSTSLMLLGCCPREPRVRERRIVVRRSSFLRSQRLHNSIGVVVWCTWRLATISLRPQPGAAAGVISERSQMYGITTSPGAGDRELAPTVNWPLIHFKEVRTLREKGEASVGLTV